MDTHSNPFMPSTTSGWSGGAMVLGKLPAPGRPTIWITVGQGPIVLAVGAGGACLDIFTLLYLFSLLSPSLWETARYRLKFCLKGPLNPKQSINQNLVQHERVIFKHKMPPNKQNNGQKSVSSCLVHRANSEVETKKVTL